MDQTKSKKAPRQGKKNKNTANLNKLLSRELLSEIRSSSKGRSPGTAVMTRKSVAAPVARASVQRASKPKFLNLPEGDILISHREYVNDISGSVAFSNGSPFSINPGLPGSFPWLSGVAQRFESYRFEKLDFEYETQAPTSATGTVLLTVDYDASDAAPVDKTQALSYRNAVRCPPWSDCCHSSLSEDLHKEKTHFVRSGALAANQDVKLYDVGTLFVSVQGQADTKLVGELYVSYRVRLMTPQIGDPRTNEAVWGEFGGVNNVSPFSFVGGNLPVTIGSTGTTTSVTTFTFSQPWSGYVTTGLTGTGITNQAVSGTGTVAINQQVNLASGLQGMAQIFLDADPGQTFILTITNTTLSNTDLTFGQSSGIR